jgi:hypothetical protein
MDLVRTSTVLVSAAVLASFAIGRAPAAPPTARPGAADSRSTVDPSRFQDMGKPPREEAGDLVLTIVHSQKTDGRDRFESKVEVEYHLAPMWGPVRSDGLLTSLLREQGVTGSPGPHATYLAAGSPRELYRSRGSVLGLKPGERLPFVSARREGRAIEYDPKGRSSEWTVTTLGNGVFLDSLRGGGPNDTGKTVLRATSAEIVRTPGGAVLWYAEDVAPGAGMTDFVVPPPGISPAQWRSVFVFVLTNQELGRWNEIHRTNAALLRDVEVAEQTMHYAGELRMQAVPDEVEVTVETETGFDQWVPEADLDRPDEAGRRLTVYLKAQKKGDPGKPRKARLDLTLVKVSREKGACLNWPAPGAAPGDGLRFLQKENPSLDVPGPDHARTLEPVEEARAVISSHDFGAWGTLHVSATDADGKSLRVRVRGKDTADLTVPLDENHNHIADSWELEKAGNLAGSRESDDEVVTGQNVRGDGITFYDEYRGVVVREDGGRRHRRLDPKTKEMFLLDPGRDFPSDSWKRVTRIQALRVDESQVDAAANPGRSPLVNFNAEDRRAHPVHALRIRRIDGDVDPDPAREGNTVQPKTQAGADFPIMAYAVCREPGIKGTEFVKVFPDRAREFVDGKIAWLQAGRKDLSSREGHELLDPDNGFSRDEAAQALAVLRTPQGYAAVLEKVRRTLFVHEFGHVCGDLPDHEDMIAPNDEIRSCLMFIRGQTGQRRMVVLSALGRGDPDFAYPAKSFCPGLAAGGLGCAPKVTTKDW